MHSPNELRLAGGRQWSAHCSTLRCDGFLSLLIPCTHLIHSLKHNRTLRAQGAAAAVNVKTIRMLMMLSIKRAHLLMNDATVQRRVL